MILDSSKMNSSNAAAVQYKNAVLKAYGFVPIEDYFPSSCSSSVYKKRSQITPKINNLALPRREETTNNESEEDSSSAEETEIPLTMKQPSHGRQTEKQRSKITKKDVLKAHGIL